VTYSISVQRVSPRPLASLHERMTIRDVPARFRPVLSQVYAAAKSHAIALDGQNVFVYRTGASPFADVEFGVGVTAAFAPVGRVAYSEAPVGDAATTTHWGDYGALGAAHDAVVARCKAKGCQLAGVSWEVYGHWSDDPAQLRTDVFHLLRPADSTPC
jgi:effector-binding domain-containing protein